jgi:hypothetical protein
MVTIEESLKSRGLIGDRLLDSLEVAELILQYKGIVSSDGYALLFHATKKHLVDTIIQEQKMYGKENGIFFSTKADGQILGYGSEVVEAKIPLEKLIIDDEFCDELHF